jgi:hypothetical protein
MDFTTTNPLPQVKLKHSLVNFVSENTTVKQIVEHIKLKFENYTLLKNDLEFLEHVLAIVKNIISKKITVDKKEIVKIIYQQLFNLNDSEILILHKQIEYLINNKIVKKIKYSQKVLKYVKKNFLPNII